MWVVRGLCAAGDDACEGLARQKKKHRPVLDEGEFGTLRLLRTERHVHVLRHGTAPRSERRE